VSITCRLTRRPRRSTIEVERSRVTEKIRFTVGPRSFGCKIYREQRIKMLIIGCRPDGGRIANCGIFPVGNDEPQASKQVGAPRGLLTDNHRSRCWSSSVNPCPPLSTTSSVTVNSRLLLSSHYSSQVFLVFFRSSDTILICKSLIEMNEMILFRDTRFLKLVSVPTREHYCGRRFPVFFCF
jgi:hypothetical protein